MENRTQHPGATLGLMAAAIGLAVACLTLSMTSAQIQANPAQAAHYAGPSTVAEDNLSP